MPFHSLQLLTWKSRTLWLLSKSLQKLLEFLPIFPSTIPSFTYKQNSRLRNLLLSHCCIGQTLRLAHMAFYILALTSVVSHVFYCCCYMSSAFARPVYWFVSSFTDANAAHVWGQSNVVFPWRPWPLLSEIKKFAPDYDILTHIYPGYFFVCVCMW